MVDFKKLEEHNETDFADDGPGDILPEQNVSRSGTEVGTVSSETALAKLKRAVEEKEQSTVTYEVPEDRLPTLGTSLSLEFSTQITTHELERWRNQSKGKNRRRDDVDGGKVAGLMLATKSVSIMLGGQKLVDDDGEPIRLTSDEILELTGARSASDAVRKLLGDGIATSLSDSLAAAAGYGDDFEDAGNPI